MLYLSAKIMLFIDIRKFCELFLICPLLLGKG